MYRLEYSEGQDMANEMMISNMIEVITNQKLSENFTNDEKKEILSAIKLHVLNNASDINKGITRKKTF